MCTNSNSNAPRPSLAGHLHRMGRHHWRIQRCGPGYWWPCPRSPAWVDRSQWLPCPSCSADPRPESTCGQTNPLLTMCSHTQPHSHTYTHTHRHPATVIHPTSYMHSHTVIHPQPQPHSHSHSHSHTQPHTRRHTHTDTRAHTQPRPHRASTTRNHTGYVLSRLGTRQHATHPLSLGCSEAPCSYPQSCSCTHVNPGQLYPETHTKWHALHVPAWIRLQQRRTVCGIHCARRMAWP